MSYLCNDKLTSSLSTGTLTVITYTLIRTLHHLGITGQLGKSRAGLATARASARLLNTSGSHYELLILILAQNKTKPQLCCSFLSCNWWKSKYLIRPLCHKNEDAIREKDFHGSTSSHHTYYQTNILIIPLYNCLKLVLPFNAELSLPWYVKFTCCRACNKLRCTDCDFKISIFDDFKWNSTTDYLFLRNNMPDFSRLKTNLAPSPGGYTIILFYMDIITNEWVVSRMIHGFPHWVATLWVGLPF